MRRSALRVAAVARRVADLVPLTVLGALVAAAAASALHFFAYARLDLVFLVLGYGALGVTGLAALVVVLSAIVLKLRIKPRTSDAVTVLETRLASPTGFSLPSLVLLPLVNVRVVWVEPDGARVLSRPRFRRVDEEIVIDERGEIPRVVRRVVVEDVFGLARVAFRLVENVPLEVRPNVGALRRLPVLTSMSGGDDYPHPMGIDSGDRVDLRRYVPGDPARFIHWKVFGRTRRLVVRVPERALSRSRRTVAYLVAGRGDDATAATARVAVDTGAFVGEWLFSADGGTFDAFERAAAEKLIVRSGLAREEGARGLRSFVERAERQGPATLVVFAPPSPGAWMDRVAAIVTPRPGRVRVVIGVDGLSRPVERPVLSRLLTADPKHTGTDARGLDEVLRVFGNLRCPVTVVDRTTGRVLGEAHRAAANVQSHDGATTPPQSKERAA